MKRRLTDLCLMAMMGTVMVVSKEALAFLPNVELVSLLTILFTLVFRRRVIGGPGGVPAAGGRALRLWHLVGDVPVHLAAAGGDYLAVPLDEARLAVGHFVRAVRLGLWDAVLFDVLPRGRGADGHRLDYQRVELRRGPRGWELFAGAAVVPPPAQSPGPAGAPPCPSGPNPPFRIRP